MGEIQDLDSLAQSLNFATPAYLLSKVRCCYCGKISVEVLETKCKHLYCSICLKKIVDGNQRCPLDSELISKDDVHKNEEMEEKIKQLSTYCPYQSNGCKAVMALGKISKHIEQCEFAALKCPQGCSAPIRASELQQHLRFFCAFRHVTCDFCDKNFVLAFQQKHLQECPRFPVECPNLCGIQNVPREEITEHLKTCKVNLKPCHFQHLGCEYQGRGRQLQLHEENMLQHFKLMADGYSYFNLQFDILMQQTRGSILHLQNDNCALRETMKELMKQFERLQQSNDIAAEKLANLRVHVHKVLQTQEQLTEKETTNDTMDSEDGSRENQDVKGQLSVFSHEMVEAMQEEVLNKIREQENRLQTLTPNNCSGVLVWKITNYSLRKEESVNRTRAFLFSDPFFTEQYGYQLCAKVFLGGDGDARGSHLSFYVIIMKGPWDDILPWPFRQKFKISLLDQRNTSHKDHITDHFSPNSSSSFLKPTMAMNVGAGVSKFIPHHIIETHDSPYLRNDIIYLKVAVSPYQHKK